MDKPLQPVPLRIDIVSDVVCPWCIIGYKQLQLALAGMGDAFEAQEILAVGPYGEVVHRDQARWLDRDVHAVPMFFFNEVFPVPGAQEADTFVRVLSRLRDHDRAGAIS
jgi:predicted DsbA family dithiol-disulfide isomerase